MIGDRIEMGSLPDLLEQGSAEAEQVVIDTARTRNASLVVLNGFRSIRGFLPSDQAAAQFL